MSKKSYIIPIFIPHRGCPHDCSFCNQRKIAGEMKEITGEDIYKITNKYLDFFPSNHIKKEVAFYGGSFTGLEMEKQIELLKPAFEMKEKGLINEIRLSTRPDYIDDSILVLLKKFGVTTIELGVQSTDNKVLELNHRGHTKEDVVFASKLIKDTGFKLGLQMMVGLLGDNITSIIKTAKDIISLNPNFVRIYPTIVIEHTYLEKLYLEGKYEPFTLEKTIEICKELLILFKKNKIPVIRLGLQSNDNMDYGKSLVAGPYHPSFRELVESEIYKDVIEKQIKKKDADKIRILNIHCNPTIISRVAGFKQSNKKYFMDKYNISDIKIIADNELDKNQLHIEINRSH
ncbi:MAG: radical SAM protein [Clostridiales bacterium]|nr:radical SAM protein [Clostridiales bacterium]